MKFGAAARLAVFCKVSETVESSGGGGSNSTAAWRRLGAGYVRRGRPVPRTRLEDDQAERNRGDRLMRRFTQVALAAVAVVLLAASIMLFQQNRKTTADLTETRAAEQT